MTFSSELKRLQQGKAVKVSSSIRTLSPVLDGQGLLRVGGRLKESDIKGKHPYVISGRHVIATTIVKDVHNVAHIGVEWVLGIVRKHFWLIRARPLIKKVIRAYITCKRLYFKPCAQPMENLCGKAYVIGAVV